MKQESIYSIVLLLGIHNICTHYPFGLLGDSFTVIGSDIAPCVNNGPGPNLSFLTANIITTLCVFAINGGEKHCATCISSLRNVSWDMRLRLGGGHFQALGLWTILP